MDFCFRQATDEENHVIKEIVTLQGRYTKDWENGPLYLGYEKENGAPVGWVRHWRTPHGRHAVMSLTVDEKYQGQKAGLYLVSQMIVQTAETGRWILDCHKSLKSYYEQIGFVEIDRALAPELLSPDELPDSICMECLAVGFRPFRHKTQA